MFGYWEAGVCEQVREQEEAVGHYGIVVELFETASDQGVATQPSLVSMAAKATRVSPACEMSDGNWSTAERHSGTCRCVSSHASRRPCLGLRHRIPVLRPRRAQVV